MDNDVAKTISDAVADASYIWHVGETGVMAINPDWLKEPMELNRENNKDRHSWY